MTRPTLGTFDKVREAFERAATAEIHVIHYANYSVVAPTDKTVIELGKEMNALGLGFFAYTEGGPGCRASGDLVRADVTKCADGKFHITSFAPPANWFRV